MAHAGTGRKAPVRGCTLVKHYQPGVPAQIELPTESLDSLYERSIAEAADCIATEFFERTTTYAELGDQISRAAEGLRRLGVGAGDRVAIVLRTARRT